MNNNIIIRKATIEDIKSINEIVNDAIKNSFSNWAWAQRTFDEAKAWFDKHNSKKHCIFVSIENGVVTGYGSLSPLRDKESYWPVVENSVYVHKDYREKKIGSALLDILIRTAKECDLRAISSWIDSENKESIDMHKKFGFYFCGELKNIGEKFGIKRSITIMQLDLEA